MPEHAWLLDHLTAAGLVRARRGAGLAVTYAGWLVPDVEIEVVLRDSDADGARRALTHSEAAELLDGILSEAPVRFAYATSIARLLARELLKSPHPAPAALTLSQGAIDGILRASYAGHRDTSVAAARIAGRLQRVAPGISDLGDRVIALMRSLSPALPDDVTGEWIESNAGTAKPAHDAECPTSAGPPGMPTVRYHGAEADVLDPTTVSFADGLLTGRTVRGVTVVLGRWETPAEAELGMMAAAAAMWVASLSVDPDGRE